MMNFENLTQEQQMQINLLAGSAMAGIFRGAGFALTLGGAALKTNILPQKPKTQRKNFASFLYILVLEFEEDCL